MDFLNQTMIVYKTPEEIEIMREAAQIVSRTLGLIAEHIEVGVTPLALDKIAEEYIRSQDAIPGFLGLYNFPNTLCMSPNAQVVHGIPDNRPLENGDIISVDCGSIYKGYYGDHAYTFEVGEVAPEMKELLRVTANALILVLLKRKLEYELVILDMQFSNMPKSTGMVLSEI